MKKFRRNKFIVCKMANNSNSKNGIIINTYRQIYQLIIIIPIIYVHEKLLR